MKNILSNGIAFAAIAVVIIGVGLYTYNSAQTTIYAAENAMAAQEQEAFNSQWTAYEGEQAGSSVKNLISKMISNTGRYTDDDKLPDLIYKVSETSEEVTVVSDSFDLNVSGLMDAKDVIETKQNYLVTLNYSEDTHFVYKIQIEYIDSEIDSGINMNEIRY